MHSPLISIIIPSLNQGKFIGRTLESIFSQRYPNVEIIVMDGGSKDTTLKMIKDFGLKIKDSNKNIRYTWESKKDKGQADAINKGWKRAKGDILCYLNSDDCFLPGALKTVSEAFSYNPEIQWVTGDYTIVDESDQPIQKGVVWYKRFLRLFPLPCILPIANPIIQPSTFIRKSFVEKVGYFDETLRYTFDYDYWFRSLRRSKPFLIPARLSAFRIHGSSKGTMQFRKQFTEELLVARRYTKNSYTMFLHRLHAGLINAIYSVLK